MNDYLQNVASISLGTEVFIIHKEKILMHKRAPTKKSFPNFLVGPGGHIDSTEDALTAAIREVREEAGIEVSEEDITLKVVAFHHHTDINKLFIIFIYRVVLKDVVEMVHQSDEGVSEWITIEDLLKRQDVFPPSAYFFDHVIQNKPGILYTNSEWKGSTLIKVLSNRVDASS